MGKTKNGQTYKYKRNAAITKGEHDYELTESEYYKLYSFFVTYSLCGTQSIKKRQLMDYGETTIKELKELLLDPLGKNIVFTEENNLKELFSKLDLADGNIISYNIERAVIGITKEQNKLLKLFYRIRNSLAHGNFLLKYSSAKEKMVVLQDNNKDNVTARMVLKLSTLLSFVDTVDKNSLISRNRTNKNNADAA